MLKCSVQLSLDHREAFAEGSLVVGDSSGRWLTVRAQRSAVAVGAEAANLTAGPYRVRRQGSDVLDMWVKPCRVELFLDGWGHGYTEPDGLTVLGGYRPAAAIADPGTW